MNPYGSTSRSLLARAKVHDADAWDRLVSLYAPLVMYWCRRWNVPEAEMPDVFQDVFRAVAANLEGFRKQRPGDSFRGWLRTITRNKIHDLHDQRRRQPQAVGGTEIHKQLLQIPLDVDQDPEEDSANARLVRRALEQIRPHFEERTWQAFWDSTIEGRSAPEVAETLGMTHGAVRVAKSRVLQRLREELGDVLDVG